MHALAALALLQALLQASAASRVPAQAPTSPGDSARAARDARRAQASFEETRRRHLPVETAHTGRCELRLLRFCFWHDDRTRPPDEAEPSLIVDARRELLEALDDAARAAPGDEWIAGQRVRYLVEAGRPAEARAAAEACGATAWWCAALRGLALHAAGEDAGAADAYARALDAMPAALRCRWTDVRVLLPSDARREPSPCGGADPLAERLWLLARPLYLRAGDDLHVEFLARHTMLRIDSAARAPFGGSWPRTAEEPVLRFGRPTWWTQHPPSAAAIADHGSVDGHVARPSWHFVPSPRLLTSDAAAVREDDWRLDAPRATTLYAPRWARTFVGMAAQVAAFPRAESTLVVARYDVSDAVAGDSLQVGLALVRDARTPVRVVRWARAERRGTLSVTVPWHPRIASVEALEEVRRAAARARVGIAVPAPGPAVSDLLLFAPGRALPTTPEEAGRTALAALRVARGGRLGVYWELRELPPAAEASVVVTVERVGAGWRTRAAERLGLATRMSPLRLRWREGAGSPSGVVPRAIVLDLAALAPGRYRVRLALDRAGGGAASERVIEIAGR